MQEQRKEMLTPLSEKAPLNAFWFPTQAQCFIYRNWEMLTPARLAAVLAAPEETVIKMAADLGLGAPATEQTQQKWLDLGYVTLIRANWHLLPYAQLLTLLGWEEDALAFVLQHDDFLDYKLGNEKPNSAPVQIQELTAQARQKTAAIAAVTKQLRQELGERTAEPFSFKDFYLAGGVVGVSGGESALKNASCVPYNALYAHVFDETYFDYSFPDELMEAYAAVGIRWVIAHGVLYNLVPFALAPELAEGCEERQEKMRQLVKRLERYGMKIMLYLNEPRDLPDSFFVDHPEYKGDVYRQGRASVCLSVPEVQDAFRKAIYDLVKAIPGLGALSLTTASENHTNCYSEKRTGQTTCPRCRNRTREELFAQVVSLVTEGAHAADPSIQIVANAWAWDVKCDDPLKGIEDVCARLPADTAVWSVSEQKGVKTVGGVKCEVIDYSISIPGPSDYSMEIYRILDKYHLSKNVKLQLNNSWEFSSVPYIPVFRHFYDNIRNLMEKGHPDFIQTNWTQGGFPSPVLQMFAELTRKDRPMPTLEELIRHLFPGADFDRLQKAFDCFDDAFDAFPFSLPAMYFGPQHIGPALPLYPENTGYASCMCGPAYDDLEKWRGHFPADIFEQQFKQIAEGFKVGVEILKEALRDIAQRPDAKLLMDCAEVTYLHFASSYNHIYHIRNRGTDIDMTALIREEEALAVREAKVMLRNPMIGFEATNHYYYTVTDLYEKVLNCRALLGLL